MVPSLSELPTRSIRFEPDGVGAALVRKVGDLASKPFISVFESTWSIQGTAVSPLSSGCAATPAGSARQNAATTANASLRIFSSCVGAGRISPGGLIDRPLADHAMDVS